MNEKLRPDTHETIDEFIVKVDAPDPHGQEVIDGVLQSPPAIDRGLIAAMGEEVCGRPHFFDMNGGGSSIGAIALG